MAVPAGAKSFHTVWIRPGDGRSVPVRYALAGDRLVAFGERIAHVRDGDKVTATIHQIANGAPVYEFGATLRVIAAAEVEDEAFLELLAHVPLGRDTAEIEAAVASHRATRRVVELVA